MKLVFTPNPKYIHKVLVVAYEAGLLDRLGLERSVPFDTDTTIWNYNPLGKVPCLVLDDGRSLFGGLIICEYLDSLSVTGTQVFPSGVGRWSALHQAMLGEGMFDATTNMRVEGWRSSKEQHTDYMLRERRKIINCLNEMNKEIPQLENTEFHIGHICVAGGLSYLDLRNPIQEHAMADGDAEFDWRSERAALSDWYDSVQQRPSIAHKVAL